MGETIKERKRGLSRYSSHATPELGSCVARRKALLNTSAVSNELHHSEKGLEMPTEAVQIVIGAEGKIREGQMLGVVE